MSETLVAKITEALDEARMGECMISASALAAIREALSAAQPAVAVPSDEYNARNTERHCRDAFEKEDGYGNPENQPKRYRIFRDGFYAAATRNKERCKCCGYLVTESEHFGCLRTPAPAASAGVPDKWKGWRDVGVHGLPEEAQEVLFMRDGKVKHGAFIGGIFWYCGQKVAAALWAPLPSPLAPEEHLAMLAAAPTAEEVKK